MKQRMRFWGNLWLLVLWWGVCNARPQTRDAKTDADNPTSSSGGGARLSNEERAFFAPGSWQPIPNQVSGLIIDEAPSRVRLEKYETSIRDARSKEETVETPVVMTTNTTGNTTTRGKSPSPLGDAIKMVASQLLQSRGGVAESDVRAPPPKVKTQQKIVVDVTAETNHQGIAIPVIIEDTEHLLSSMTKKTPTSTTTTKTTTPIPTKKTHGTTVVYEKKTQSTPTLKKQQSTTKKPTAASLRDPVTSIPDGLTTWVFLSGSSPTTLLATTPSPTISTKLSTKPMVVTTKKTHRITTTTVATPSEKTHNVVKKPSPLFTSSGTKPNRMTKKPVAAVEESATVLSTKNKNKQVVASSATENKDKPTASRLEGEKLETIAFRRRPVSSEIEAVSSTTTFKPLPTAYPLSTAATDEGSAETSSEDESTEVAAEETTKRTRQPGEKKKKKNKNKRRRRPVVKPQEEEDNDEIESKIESDDDEEEGLTKVPVKSGKPARPLTTRIYNFLAREIMPSVGVGLIGLVGLAGLAGLIMYPFGGGALPIRRNYEETPKPNYYYYENDAGGQSEEEVLGKVLAGMKDPSYVVGEQQTYQEPESRKPIQQGETYTRYDVGGRISNHKETQQPIRNDYDVAGRISSTAPQNRDAQQPIQQYDTEVGSRVSGSVRVGGSHQDYESDVTSRIAAGQNKEVVIQGSVHKDDTHYGSDVAARSPVQNRGSQRVGESEAVAAPQASALYATRNEPRPVFNNDWSMVKTDAQEAVSLNNNNHNNHELKYGGDVDAIYGQSAQREERLRYDTAQSPQYSGVSRVGVGQKRTVTVEHGPRRLKRDVIKKDSAKEDLEENEIIGLEVSDEPVFTVQRVEIVDNDEEAKEKITKSSKKDLGMSLKKTTPTKLEAVDMETTTYGKTVTEVNTDSAGGYTDKSNESNENSNEYSDEKIDSAESTTRVIVKKIDVTEDSGKDETTSLPVDVTTVTEENITLETESPEDPSLIGLIRRVAQYKIRLGLSFLRNTSQAFSRYLEGMQKRVENIVKENAKNRSKLQKRKTAHEDDYY